jgi:lipopolysaccharide transport system permease protein
MNTSLILNFAKQDLIERYSGSVLGGVWSFIIPLANIMIFVLIFSKIMGAKLSYFGVNFSEYSYSIYLVSGILAWNSFANILLRTTNLFKEKSSFITKVHINLVLLPIYILISESIIFALSLFFFLLFLLAIGFPITWHWLLVPLVYMLQIMFAYGLGLLLATLSVFIKDIREFVKIIIQLWFWCTPIVYVVHILPEKLAFWFQLNPIYLIIIAYRDIIIRHQLPDLSIISSFFLVSLILIIVAIKLLKKLEKDLRDFI